VREEEMKAARMAHQTEQLAGITAPWAVTAIEVDAARREVVVKVECGRTVWAAEEGVVPLHSA
jgi:hypothetical protein